MKNMKKIFSIFSVLFLALVLVACKKDEAVDPAQEKLDNAYDAVMVLFENPQEITSNLSLPTSMAGGVTVEWSSSEPGAASVGTPSGGFVTITINRTPGVDTNAVLTAKFSIPAENSDEILTRSRDIPIKIIASADLNIPRGNIGEILAIVHPESDPSNKADKLDVNLQNVTIFAQGEGSVVFGYDGTGIIQFYGGTNEWEVGKVYNVSGLLEWYFGIWEVIDPVATLVEDATPQFPEKETITDPNAFVADLVAAGEHEAAFGDVTDGNFEPIWATVTGTIFMSDDNPGNNYNTFLLSSDFDTENPGVPGTQGNPAEGLMFYYGTNGFSDIRGYDGFEIIIDVVIYTYRSNNHAFAIYFTGDEITTGELTDEQTVELDASLLTLPLEVLANGELDLVAEGENGSTITWELLDPTQSTLVNLTTGAVTIPTDETQPAVKLKATITKGEETETKEFTVYVGVVQTFTLLEARDIVNGRTIKVSGVVLGHSGNNTIAIQDATSSISLFGTAIGANHMEDVEVGDTVTVTGKKTVFNGLHQIDRTYTLNETAAGTLPAAADLNALADFTAELLLPLQSARVNLSEVLVKTITVDQYDNVSMTLERVDGKTIAFRWDSRVAFEGSAALVALEEGDYINLVGAILGWNNGAQLTLDNASMFEETEELSDEAKVAAAKGALELTTLAFPENGTVTLPTTLNGVAVTWALEDPTQSTLVNLETGAVTVGTEFAEVVLVATLTLGEATDTKEFTLLVGEAAELEVFRHYKFDVGTYPGSGTGYSQDDEFTWTESFGSETVKKDRVQINKSTFDPHDGQAMLVFSLRSTYNREAYIEFDFTALTDLAQISFEVSAWNNSLMDQVKAVPNGKLNLQVKVGDNWVDIESTDGDTDVLQLLVADQYVEFIFEVDGPGVYRIVYSGDSTATGNTTTALTVDNLKLYS